jgi:hypothetical protein
MMDIGEEARRKETTLGCETTVPSALAGRGGRGERSGGDSAAAKETVLEGAMMPFEVPVLVVDWIGILHRSSGLGYT